MKSMLCSLSFLLLFSARADKPWLPELSAAPYEAPAKGSWYVDFEGGSDEADGRSPAAAFKHCPGDANAVGNAARAELAPGDVVIFKGGVEYRSTLSLRAKGTAGQPIVFDGNTAGLFGEGPAIIEGGDPVTGWRRCRSADEAGGNPRWEEIFVADLPLRLSWKDANLATAERAMPVAQHPNPSDPHFQENPADYYRTEEPIQHSAPLRIALEPGTQGNSQRPLLLALPSERGSAVVSPVVGAAFSVYLQEPEPVSRLGIMMQPKYTPVKEMVWEADGKELLRVTLEKDLNELQMFDLPEAVSFKKLTFRFLSVHGEIRNDWTAIAKIAALTPEGKNLFDVELSSMIRDPENLTEKDPEAFAGITVGFHAGANALHYAPVTGFDPQTGTLHMPYFGQKVYKDTKYSLFNGVTLIDRPGEFAVAPGPDGKGSRIFYLPTAPLNGQPEALTVSPGRGGIEVDGGSHLIFQGLHLRRQSRKSAINIRNAREILIRDCDVTLVRAGTAVYAGTSEGITLEGCRIAECPGHTKGIVLQKSSRVSVRACRLDRNTSTALDYYTCTDGDMSHNYLTNHKGMHANGLTLYLGCKNIRVEGNVVTGGNAALTFQEAENLTFVRNVLDGDGGSMAVGIWDAKPLKNIRFIRNTIVGGKPGSDWQVGIFNINKSTENMLVENNILDGAAGEMDGVEFKGNAYLRVIREEQTKTEPGMRLIENPEGLFMDPAAGDYRLRPEAGLRGVGAYGD